MQRNIYKLERNNYKALIFLFAFILLFNKINATDARNGIRISTFGFLSRSSQIIMESIISSPTLIEEININSTLVQVYRNSSVAIENVDEPYLFLTKDENPELFQSYSDIAFVYADEAMLLNGKSLIRRLQQSFKSLLSSNDAIDSVNVSNKKKLFVLFCGSRENATTGGELISDAWSNFNKDSNNKEITEAFDLRFLLLPISSSSSPQVSVESYLKSFATQAINECTANVRTFDECFTASSNNLTNAQKSPSPTFAGLECLQLAAEDTVVWIKSVILVEETILKLQDVNYQDQFAGFISNLIKSSTEKYNILAKENLQKVGITSLTSLDSFSQALLSGIRGYVLDILAPFYKKQLQLSATKITTEFGVAVDDEIEVTPNLAIDVTNAMNSAFQKFEYAMKKLTPSVKEMPRLSWNANIQKLKLETAIRHYVDNKIAEAKVVGIVSRERKPIDVSIHWFLSHPLGRDYKQEPLGVLSSDKVIFDDNLRQAVLKQSLVSPVKARKQLKQEVKDLRNQRESMSLIQKILSYKKLSKLKQKSEFAREMLMFPLVIKNPEVPLASRNRARRGGLPSPLARDPNSIENGPERFIRWDISPMDEARRSLDALAQPDKSLADNILVQ
eukprot:gene8311-11244_t